MDEEQVVFVEEIFKPETPKLTPRLLWFEFGYYRSSSDFNNKTQATAVALAAAIPYIGGYASAAIAINSIWSQPDKTLYYQRNCLIRSDGMYEKFRTDTYSDKGYSIKLTTGIWSAPIRVNY